jgi:hypothetical protein
LNTKNELFIFDNNLNRIWRKEYPALVRFQITNFSQCKNTLLVLSDKLYAYEYKETGEAPCPLWKVTKRELTEEGDGVMTPHEVREFITGTPVVFVNGCKSEDLARAFLLGGAMAYLGTTHPVHDTSTADIAANFYDLCLKYQIGKALRRARESHMEKDLVWAK